MKIERAPLSTDPPDIHYDHFTRATIVNQGFDKMLFFIDDNFKKNLGSSFLIKVTYYDNAKNNWVLNIPVKDKPLSSNIIENNNDKKWKTVTFSLEKPLGNKKMEYEADFRLCVISGGDLTVRFVRVVKQE